MSAYAVVNLDGVPAVSQVPAATTLPLAFASTYRTLTGRDIVAGLSGQIAPASPNYGRSMELGVWASRAYLAQVGGPASGSLIVGTVPTLAAEGVDGDAVEYLLGDVPVRGSAASGGSTGQDADLWWLYRTFGKR